MGISHFQQGVSLQIDQRQHIMKRQLDDDTWQTEETKTGRLHNFNIEELQAKYESASLVFFDERKPTKNLENIDSSKVIAIRQEPDAELWDRAKVRRSYVKAVENLPVTKALMVEAISQVWNKIKQPGSPPHWVTVADWKAKYIANGKDAYALVDQYHARGNRTRRYPLEVLELIDDAIETVYLQRERNTVEDTWEEAIVLVTRENKLRPSLDQLPRPTRRLVSRQIEEIPVFDRWAARYGRTAALRKFRAKLRHLVTKAPLESAEIDHTKLDLFVLNDDDLMPLGRPWLTICIDCHTRCILGIYIGFEPPSYLTVAKCLKHAFLPKTSLRKQFPSIRHPWEAHGVMEKLIVDNGLEFHCESLEKSCYSLGIEIEYTPRRTPWFKGKIERFNRTINEGVSHGTPGTTFHNTFEKDDYDPAKHAVVTLSVLREIVHKWIADYYHQKPHRALDGVSPAAMWQSSIELSDINLADDPGQIDVLLGKAVSDKPLTHKGIEINRLLYNSPELVGLRRQYGSELKVEIRVDEENIGHLYVMLPDGSGYFDVPAIDKDYAWGMSLWLHNLCRKYAKLNLNADDPYHWALAKSEIREMVQTEMQFKRKKSNGRVGRYLESDKQARKSASTPKPRQTPERPPVPLELQLMSPVPRPQFKPVIETRKAG